MLVAKMLQKGQIVIPKAAREKAHIGPGDKVEVRVTEQGIVILPIKKGQAEHFQGTVTGRLSLKELERLYAEKR